MTDDAEDREQVNEDPERSEDGVETSAAAGPMRAAAATEPGVPTLADDSATSAYQDSDAGPDTTDASASGATAPSSAAEETAPPAGEGGAQGGASSAEIDPHRAARRSAEGAPLEPAELDPYYFDVDCSIALLHQVTTAQLAARRAGTQSTRTRAEISGGGAKPFRQKGTGRARQGSTRAPHWSGGGVALGPKPRSYVQRTPKKMVALALRAALSDRARLGRVCVADAFDWESPSTRRAVQLLGAFGMAGRVLVVTEREDEAAQRSFRNLPYVQVSTRGELAAYDILRADWLLFSDATLPRRAELDEGAEPAGSRRRRDRRVRAGRRLAPEQGAASSPEEVPA